MEYELLESPENMEIDPETGEITWTALGTGDYLVSILVTDETGAEVVQSFDLHVFTDLVNNPPRITSNPLLSHIAGSLYEYQAVALDADEEEFTFTLEDGPQGMFIDPLTGLLQWAPPIDILGYFPVSIRVEDIRGGWTRQRFDVHAYVEGANVPPVVASLPPTLAEVEQLYSYQVVVTDFDDDPIHYELLSEHAWMSLDSETGLITGVPLETGTLTITIRVHDGRGGFAIQEFDLEVVEDLNATPYFTSRPETNGVADEEYEYLAQAQDPDSDPLTYALLNPELLEGMEIDEETGLLTWTPELIGVYTVIIRATDPHGRFADQEFQLRIGTGTLNRSPSICSAPLTRTTAGEEYEYQVTANDPDLDSLSFHLVDPEEGMEIDEETGLLTWSSPDAGTYEIRIQVLDGAGGVTTQTFELVVVPAVVNHPPRITSAPGTVVEAGSLYSYQVLADDLDLDTLSFELIDLETGMSEMEIDEETGMLTWTPSAPGSYPITIRVTDEQGASHQQKYWLDVTPVPENSPPVITSVPVTTGAASTSYSYDAHAVDPNGHTLTYSLIDDSPEWLSVNSSTGLINGTAPSTGSTVTVTLQVSDGNGGTAIQSWDIVVAPPPANRDPVITSNPIARISSGSYSYTVVASDPDGQTPTYSLLSGHYPSGMTINSSTGVISWSSTSGDHEVVIQASDGVGGVGQQKFMLVVGSGITSNPVTHGTAGTAYSYNVTLPGTHEDYELITKPHVSMTIGGSSGAISWPSPTAGTHSIVIRAVDTNENEFFQSFELVIAAGPANAPPVITSGPPTTAEADALYVYDVAATDANSDTLTYSLTTKPDGMTINSSTGLIEWTPNDEEDLDESPHSILVSVSDGQGNTTTQRFDLLVRPATPNAVPVITSHPPTSGTIHEEYTYDVGASDADSETLTYTLIDKPTEMTINSSTGLISWTPDTLGPVTIRVKVADPSGAYDEQKYVLLVSNDPATLPPVITSAPPTSIIAGNPYFYQAQGDDPEETDLTWSLSESPDGMTIDPETGLIEWETDAENRGEEYWVTVVLTDHDQMSSQQRFRVLVESTDLNRPPTITSTPPTFGSPEVPIVYQAVAVDPNFGDEVTWTLGDWIEGMEIDLETGLFEWTPGENVTGEFPVTIVATDRHGAMARQSFTIVVQSGLINRPPVITSSPVTSAAVNELYSYQIVAADVDEDPLTYELLTGPAGIDFDDEIGLLSWIPTPGDVALHTVRVRVSDSRGMFTIQQFAISVTNTVVNFAPEITSTPPFVAVLDGSYTYDVDATDQNPTDTLVYSFYGTRPNGMEIDPVTGVVSWTPLLSGNFAVTVQVSDGARYVRQGFSILVRSNSAPTIDAVPANVQVAAGQTLSLSIRGRDLDGDLLSYSFVGEKPDGMEINSSGLITWPTTLDDVDTYPLQVQVTDPLGASALVSFNLQVIADTSAPTVSILAGHDPALLGQDLVVRVHAVDNVAVQSRTLTVNGTPIFLDSAGRGVIPGALIASAPGPLVLAAVATDTSGNSSSLTREIDVVDPADAHAPTTLISTPGDTTFTLKEITDVIGTVSDPDDDLHSWTLTLTPVAGGETIILANGTSPVSNGSLGTIDTTNLRNGLYYLTLSALDTLGKVSEIERTIEISADLKLGNYAVSFTDLSVSVGGMSIVVTRSYNSLNASQDGEFGYGWNLGLSNTSLDVRHIDGAVQTSFGGDDLPFRDGTRVIITLPDGKREGFTFYGEPGNQALGIVTDWKAKFLPDYGVTSQIVVEHRPLQKTPNGEYLHYASGTAYNPALAEFGGTYTLKLRNGVELAVNAQTGDLDTITDLTGNQLQFSEDGIESANRNNPSLPGRKVEFERDSRGRITAVIDPSGNRITYAYDANGDLTSVTDRTGAVTTYTYLEESPHYLDEIIDPLGISAARTEYDEVTGRVSKVTDADGQTIEYTYNTETLVQTVTDQLGHVTTITLNANGDVIREERPDGGITKRTFNDKHHLLTETLVVGLEDTESSETNDLTTTYTYDSAGNGIKVSDSRGLVTRATYNQYGQPTSTTDALGNTTRITYDQRGLPSSSTDALGNRTTYTYDVRGNSLTTRDSTGNLLVTNTYNSFGDLLTTTPAGGRTTTYTYDLEGRPTSSAVTDPATGIVFKDKTVYGDAGRVTGTSRVKIISGAETTISSTSISYDDNGQVLTFADDASLVTQNTYDIRGQLIQTRRQAKDSDGDTTWLLTRSIYDEAGRLTASTEEYEEGTTAPIRGSITEYDEIGRVILSESRLGMVIDMGWLGSSGASPQETILADDGTLLTSSATEYDTLGRVTLSTDPYGFETQYTYNPFGNVTQTRRETLNEEGETAWLISRTLYDSFNRAVLSTSYLEGSTDPVQATQPLFDSFGRTIGARTYSDVVIDLETDGSTSLVSVGEVLYSTSTIINAKGQTVSSTDALGNVTNYEYDTLGRRTAVIAPAVIIDGTTLRLRSETTYDSLGRVASEITNLRQLANGTVDRTFARTAVPTYDPFGNVISTTVTALDGAGHSQSITTSATYDDKGRKLSETDAVNGTKNFTYDAQGRLIEVKLPPVTDPDVPTVPARPTYTYAYDSRGNQTSIVDPYGRETRFTYDDQGRQLSRTLPLGFGEDGILGTGDDSSVDPGNFTETFEYDERGRTIKHVTFEGVVHTFEYDPETGRLASEQFFDNVTLYDDGAGTPSEVVEYTYDHLGRQVAVEHTTSVGTQTRAWTYDSHGKLVQASTPEGVVNYEYDVFGRRTRTFTGSSSSDPINDFRYTYDQFGRLNTVTVYERNDVPLATNGREITDYDYDLLGNLAKTVNPNGVIDQYEYDSLSRLKRLTHFAPDETPENLSNNAKISQYDYTLRADGKKTGSTEKVWIDSVEKTNTFEWDYDNNGRLTDEIFTSYDELLSQTSYFTFDLAGNRLKQEIDQGNDESIDETTEYTYDANDRLLSETGGDEETTYEYDHTQQTEKTVTDTATDQIVSKVEYTWDVRGRLAVAVVTSYTAGVASKIEKAEYQYDEKHLRVSVKNSVDPTASGTFSSYTTTTYLNDNRNFTGNSQVLEETTRNSSNVILSKKLYTLGHQRISQTTITYTSGSPTSYVTHFFLLDARGSTRVLVDGEGEIVTYGSTPQVIVYSAYGELIGLTDDQIATAFRYVGEQFDSLTQLQYNEARYTQLWSGTFLGLDPYFGNLSDPLSLHKYNYTSRDPISFIDPNGKMAIAMGFGATMLGGAKLFGHGGVNAAVGWRAGKAAEAMFLANGLRTNAPLELSNDWSDPIMGPLTDLLVSIDQFFNPPNGPGFWEGMIPVWGPGRTAWAHAQNGDLVFAGVFLGLAILDGVGVGGVLKSGYRKLTQSTTSVASAAAPMMGRSRIFADMGDEAAARYIKSLSTTAKGDMGEDMAKHLLIANGYTDIVEIKNASSHGIDLVALAPDGKLSFFEIKSSTTNNWDNVALSPAQADMDDFVVSRLEKAAAGSDPQWRATSQEAQDLAQRLLNRYDEAPHDVNGTVIRINLMSGQFDFKAWNRRPPMPVQMAPLQIPDEFL